MLPLSLLKTAENHPMLIELKNGDTYNGRLVSCNVFMNICLRDVICTSKDGDRFWKMPEVYIRGNSIKYLRIPDEIIDLVAEEEQNNRKNALRAVKGGRTAGRIGGGGRGGDNDNQGNSGRGQGRGYNNYSSGRGDNQGRGYSGRGEGGRGDGQGRGYSGRGDGQGRGYNGRGDGQGRGYGGRGGDGGRGGGREGGRGGGGRSGGRGSN